MNYEKGITLTIKVGRIKAKITKVGRIKAKGVKIGCKSEIKNKKR